MNGFVEKSTHDMGIIVTVTINAKGMLLCLKHATEITSNDTLCMQYEMLWYFCCNRE